MFSEKDLRAQLRKVIIGQDDAIEAVTRAMTVATLGLCDPHRPLGTFLFLGPTGVGKSEVGRTLAYILHGDNVGMGVGLVVVNCTEFRSPHDTAKLIGAPPGYLGHDHPPFLTAEKIAARGTVLLFEEIEKADKTFSDLLLQILERGEAVNGQGQTLNFCNCIIILTSNLGAREMDQVLQNSAMGFGSSGRKFDTLEPAEAADRLRKVCTKAVEEFFNPEFLNRMDETVIFNHLEECHLLTILEKFLVASACRLMMSVGCPFVISEAAKQFLLRKGTNLHYGARPLRRAVRRFLDYRLAAALGEYPQWANQPLRVDLAEDGESLVVAQMLLTVPTRSEQAAVPTAEKEKEKEEEEEEEEEVPDIGPRTPPQPTKRKKQSAKVVVDCWRLKKGGGL